MDKLFRRHPLLLPLVLLGALLLFAAVVRAKPPVTLREVLQNAPPDMEVEYDPEIDKYPALTQRLGARVREMLAEWKSWCPGEDDCGRSLSVELDYRLVAQAPRVVAVEGLGMAWNITTHPVSLRETLVWLPEKQQWLTPPMLISDVDGWQTLRDYVCEGLYRQVSTEYPEEDQSEQRCQKTQRSWMDMGVRPSAYEYFLPLINEDGLIAALQFLFPLGRSGPYPDHVWVEVDVPASVLYPHIAAKYRDLFVMP